MTAGPGWAHLAVRPSVTCAQAGCCQPTAHTAVDQADIDEGDSDRCPHHVRVNRVLRLAAGPAHKPGRGPQPGGTLTTERRDVKESRQP